MIALLAAGKLLDVSKVESHQRSSHIFEPDLFQVWTCIPVSMADCEQRCDGLLLNFLQIFVGGVAGMYFPFDILRL